MTEKFYMLIDASTEDGVHVAAKTDIKVACSKSTAVGVLVNLLRSSKEIETLILDAMMTHMAGDKIVDKL